MVLPNTIIIGAQKAGTTSLFDWLSQHPDVFGEKAMKDFPFFIDDKFYSKGLEWFSKSFKRHKNEKIILHGCVNYLFFSKLSSERIYKDLGKDTKLIVILRNPIDRAYSAFWQQRKVGYEDLLNFEDSLKAEEKRLKGSFKEKSSLTYIHHGFYYRQIKDFFQYFNRTNIKVLIFEELFNNKKEEIKNLFSFLEVDNTFTPKFKKLNKSGIPKSFFLQKLLTYNIIPNLLKDKIPITYRIYIKNFLKAKNIKDFNYPSLDPKIEKQLYQIYFDDVKSLSNFLEKDLLKIWNFDKYFHIKE